MNFLELSNIYKQNEKNYILTNITFKLLKGQKLAIAGETGSGKTTLLKIIGGLIQPDDGIVTFNGVKVPGPMEKLLPGHPKIAYLSQHFELPNHYYVEELLQYENKLSQPDAENIYRVCDISHLLHRKTQYLSGGERQRIAITRALISSPHLLLFDEPFSNLDMIHKNVLKEVIKNVNQQLNISCILVSHDPLDILAWADEIIVLKEGKIIQQDVPFNIYYYPVDLYVAGLFGHYTRSDIFFDNKINDIKKIIIRPSELKINKNGKGTPGLVQDIRFFGSYCEVEIHLDNKIIYVNINDLNVKKGDQIYLEYSGALNY